ncbi:hypothetical protein CC85DRAFT_289398 [Cutaneotrichosporon oleaginosum]|uniref:SH3 domain-containing protein n=1 Tax=Cutaneotrichosporon oleaginosum TaxID=879819 RepID=A0A0J0XBY4_9TREE|nr:uncharacterized protein CC85DRAFT_289398 [Cutaneotrichosporon oleaginosum]KLT38583.1 hypothetical protein CC85DRAFT_289398 [Cutaneotrichosporon oleaginosum]TXT08468.1 hypothetical protein COLE_05392 [Cutaneotrichosporon oleaginosum]
MVGFLIPIPSKVVDNVYNGGSNFVKSYKKEPLPTDLSATPGGDDKAPPPAPAPRRSSASWGGRAAPAPARAGGPARASAPVRPAAGTNMETFGPQLLSHVLDSIKLLETVGQITPEAARTAAAALEGTADAGYAVPKPAPARGAARVPPAPPTEIRATALWDYGQGGDADDLAFKEGDTVVIDEEVNDEWLRGRTIPKGHSTPLPKSGLFPSNYIQRM